MPDLPLPRLAACSIALLALGLATPASATWPHDPNTNLALCQASGDQLGTIGVSDGAGGAIFAWIDNRTGTGHLCAQRVSASGTPLWTTDGVLLSTATGGEFSPAILADGAGGAIVAYQDVHGSFYDIYAQRVNAVGVPQWTGKGVPLCAATGDQWIQPMQAIARALELSSCRR